MAETEDERTGGPHAEREPDYRFTLANERTFLAWLRTSLSLLAAGVAVVQLVPAFPIPGARALTGGLLTGTGVEVTINRHVAEADVAIVVGPVFPHEVVGFSGGNKYFFPGVSGQEVLDLSHWVGALITSAEMIGTSGVTPVLRP